MFNRKLLADAGLAMLLALPAFAPVESSPRITEPSETIAARTAEPTTLAAVIGERPQLRVNAGVGL